MRDISVETGIRPFFNGFHIAMLHRIPVNVIDMLTVIRFVTDKVFPESPLPYASLSPFSPALENFLTFFDMTGKISLDQAPSNGESRIAIRQHPDAMQMIWQYNRCRYLEWMFSFYMSKGGS